VDKVPTSRDEITRRAQAFEVAAVLALVLLGLNLLREAGAVAFGFGLFEAAAGQDWQLFKTTVGDFLTRMVPLIPAVIMLGAVWAARGMLVRVGRGELFSAANGKAIAEIGSSLWWGALFAMIGVPFIQETILSRGGFGVRIETETLVIAVAGGAVMVLGDLMVRALADNEALRAELGDFV
jgi:hypothetical protein